MLFLQASFSFCTISVASATSISSFLFISNSKLSISDVGLTISGCHAEDHVGAVGITSHDTFTEACTTS
jgi:hypothetical protein